MTVNTNTLAPVYKTGVVYYYVELYIEASEVEEEQEVLYQSRCFEIEEYTEDIKKTISVLSKPDYIDRKYSCNLMSCQFNQNGEQSETDFVKKIF